MWLAGVSETVWFQKKFCFTWIERGLHKFTFISHIGTYVCAYVWAFSSNCVSETIKNAHSSFKIYTWENNCINLKGKPLKILLFYVYLITWFYDLKEQKNGCICLILRIWIWIFNPLSILFPCGLHIKLHFAIFANLSDNISPFTRADLQIYFHSIVEVLKCFLKYHKHSVCGFKFKK